MFFAFCFVGSSILSGILAGGGGMAVTGLDGDLTLDAVSITVDSTDMFLANDYVTIGDEDILYTGKDATHFTGCTRGCNSTDAVPHDDDSNLYTTDASTLNSALGFNVASTAATYGAFSIIILPLNFFRYTLPRLIAWNFAFLQGDLAWVAYFFFAVSIGFVVVLAIQLALVAQGIIRRP